MKFSWKIFKGWLKVCPPLKSLLVISISMVVIGTPMIVVGILFPEKSSFGSVGALLLIVSPLILLPFCLTGLSITEIYPEDEEDEK